MIRSDLNIIHSVTRPDKFKKVSIIYYNYSKNGYTKSRFIWNRTGYLLESV